MTHELKTWRRYFQEVKKGVKQFETRKNDRNFKVGDLLLLKEWDNEKGKYTGDETCVQIEYILHGGSFGIEKGYVAMSITQ